MVVLTVSYWQAHCCCFFWLHVVFVSLCRRCSKRSRTQKQLGTPCRQGVCVCECAICYELVGQDIPLVLAVWLTSGGKLGRAWIVCRAAAAMGHTTWYSWYSCWIQDFLTSAYRSYRGWSNTILGILYCFMLVVLSSKPHQRIRILQSSVLSAAYPAASSPRLLSLSGRRKPIALAHQNWLYNLIQPGWFIHPGGTSS